MALECLYFVVLDLVAWTLNFGRIFDVAILQESVLGDWTIKSLSQYEEKISHALDPRDEALMGEKFWLLVLLHEWTLQLAFLRSFFSIICTLPRYLGSIF